MPLATCLPLCGLSGGKIPQVGLGTWRASPQEVISAVTNALDNGYRHIDTAFNYNNEEAIGEAINKWIQDGKGTREDLFITTKLPNFGNRASDVNKFINLSLQRLKLEYIDLYLIHMPFAFKCNLTSLSPAVNEDGGFMLDLVHNNLETWKAMEELVKQGLVRSIGLSNFNAEQLKQIYEKAEIKPSVLQVELHAYLQQKELRAICKDLDIIVTAYSPLGSPGANTHFSTKYNYIFKDFPDILGEPIVQEIAKSHKKSPGQTLLRHLIQNGIVVIPKSGNPKRIKENIDIFDFELTNVEMAKMNELDKGEEGRIFDFRFFKGVEDHPDYPFKKSDTHCKKIK